ncbi:MAG: hypothetical protein IJZ66_05705 [Oscillibacter sp.]|nr:hypothetical protein [Oscillibacter sp.]
MSWNNRLYVYAQKRGAACFDTGRYDWTGVALLEHKGQPVVVKCWRVYNRYGSTNTIQVQLRCQLERPYTLKIGEKTALRKGINTVLGQLDKGVERLSKDVDLYRDYGFPEVTAGRGIKTDDGEFTQMVLRDLELRTALVNNPSYGLRIEPNAPKWIDGQEHLITAWCEVNDLDLTTQNGWDLGDMDDDWGTPDQHREYIESSSFAKKLDALVNLAKAAHGAVLTWRMPAKKD